MERKSVLLAAAWEKPFGGLIASGQVLLWQIWHIHPPR